MSQPLSDSNGDIFHPRLSYSHVGLEYSTYLPSSPIRLVLGPCSRLCTAFSVTLILDTYVSQLFQLALEP